MQRRQLLRTGLAAAVPLATLGLNGWPSARALAATVDAWPEAAFHAEALDGAIAALLGEHDAADSDRIVIEAPDIAENGRVVPVEIGTDLPGARSVTVFSDGNPFPLLARARLTSAVAPRVSIRVKLGQSANLIALVEADGGLYRATRAVKVALGGCGG